jgi:perosamine synthetase
MRSDGSEQSPAVSIIALSEPEIGGREWEYVKDCLDSGWVSSVGAYVERFEQAVASYVGARQGVATSSGTAALHVALQVAGIQPNDEVLVSTLTFIAPANAIRYVGAWPVFLDADPRYWQLDVEKLESFLKTQCDTHEGRPRNKATGRTVRAIVPVHILGHPCDIASICDVARRYGLYVIEDATESLGACYDGKPIGSWGDAACFSFNGNKLLTTGGGGMVVTDREDWAKRAKYLTTQAKDDPVEYIHHDVGYNYRLTNVQAAIGCAQLERIHEFLEKKRRIAARYAEAFEKLTELQCPNEAPRAKSAWWLYTVMIDPHVAGVDRRRVLALCQQRGVQTRPLWQPLHRSPAHRHSQAYRCEVADWLYERALSLPSSVGLQASDQDRVIDAFREALSDGSGGAQSRPHSVM